MRVRVRFSFMSKTNCKDLDAFVSFNNVFGLLIAVTLNMFHSNNESDDVAHIDEPTENYHKTSAAALSFMELYSKSQLIVKLSSCNFTVLIHSCSSV